MFFSIQRWVPPMPVAANMDGSTLCYVNYYLGTAFLPVPWLGDMLPKCSSLYWYIVVKLKYHVAGSSRSLIKHVTLKQHEVLWPFWNTWKYITFSTAFWHWYKSFPLVEDKNLSLFIVKLWLMMNGWLKKPCQHQLWCWPRSPWILLCWLSAPEWLNVITRSENIMDSNTRSFVVCTTRSNNYVS